MNISSQTPIRKGDLPSLENVQGNILKAHGRQYSQHLLLNIERDANTDDIKGWLGNFSTKNVTSAAEQYKQTEEKSAQADTLFCSVFLSAEGYRRLGFTKGDLNKFRDTSFVQGMRHSGPQLGDPAVDLWERPYQQPIHGMILLASDSQSKVEEKAREFANEFEARKVKVTTEVGFGRAKGDKHLVDPFNYAHGISQPLLVATEAPKEGTPSKWDPAAPPSLALVQDPIVADPEARGSYLVFRKLEMDVRGFNSQLERLAKALGITGNAAMDKAAALVAGRYKNGDPLTDPESSAKGGPSQNDFNYEDDKLARICPFHSHIRKANPRHFGKNGLPDKLDRQHRIVRRGVNYRDPPNAKGGESVKEGMLFMCYQADIWWQFEFMQKRWLNAENFPSQAAGRDPIVGYGGRTPQEWPAPGQKGAAVKFDFGGFVQLKGGEYFFAPSIPFLKGLGKGAVPHQ